MARLPVQAADRIHSFVEEAGAPLELLARLSEPGHALGADASAAAALAEMGTLFSLLGAMGGEAALARIRFDLSLARGLDYYTGLIYEAVLLRGAWRWRGRRPGRQCRVHCCWRQARASAPPLWPRPCAC